MGVYTYWTSNYIKTSHINTRTHQNPKTIISDISFRSCGGVGCLMKFESHRQSGSNWGFSPDHGLPGCSPTQKELDWSLSHPGEPWNQGLGNDPRTGQAFASTCFAGSNRMHHETKWQEWRWGQAHDNDNWDELDITERKEHKDGCFKTDGDSYSLAIW